MWSGANGDGGGVVVGCGRGKEKGSLCVVQSSELASELVSEPRKSGYPSCILRAYFRACVRASEKCVRASEEWLSLIYRPRLGSEARRGSETEARRVSEARRGSETLSGARKQLPRLGSEVLSSDPRYELGSGPDPRLGRL